MAGRPAKDISLYRDEISNLISDGLTYNAIRTHLSTVYGVETSSRSFARYLAKWNIGKYNKPVDCPELRMRISALFFTCLQDKNILKILQKEGYKIKARVLQQIRKDMGLLRRVDPFNQKEAQRLLFEIVQKELDKGHIEGYGRGNLYAYFRSQMHIVSRLVI